MVGKVRTAPYTTVIFIVFGQHFTHTQRLNYTHTSKFNPFMSSMIDQKEHSKLLIRKINSLSLILCLYFTKINI